MYELMVLGQLVCKPMHGYMIACIMDDIMGPFRRIQWGALYPVLTRLEQQGHIEVVDQGDDGGRKRKVYRITESGRQLLCRHIMDTEHHLADYDEVFAYKTTLMYLLSPQERLQLCRHYWVYTSQNIEHFERERQDLVDNRREFIPQERMEAILDVMKLRMEYWRQQHQWADRLIEQYRPKEAL